MQASDKDGKTDWDNKRIQYPRLDHPRGQATSRRWGAEFVRVISNSGGTTSIGVYSIPVPGALARLGWGLRGVGRGRPIVCEICRRGTDTCNAWPSNSARILPMSASQPNVIRRSKCAGGGLVGMRAGSREKGAGSVTVSVSQRSAVMTSNRPRRVATVIEEWSKCGMRQIRTYLSGLTSTVTLGRSSPRGS